jgi:S-methylmethionine-dependent homocysteine/selenocysteine methylase
MQWVDMGAEVVGGCCEIGPGHIARIRQALDA